MKAFILFLKMLLIVTATNCAAQSLIKCNGRMAYWAIPVDNFYYTIRLNGDIDLSAQPDILNVNESALQYILLDKQQYAEKVSENDNEKILLKYTDEEAIHLRKKFNSPNLETHREIINFHSGKTAVFWYFKLPEGKNKEVTAQLFTNVIVDDRIFGIGTPLFAGEDFDAAKVFLLETIDTMEKVKKPDTLCP